MPLAMSEGTDRKAAAAARTVMRFKRRLVTVLSADVVGYSRLMGADDELTLSTLKLYRQVMGEVIQRTHGRMFGVAGDSWMAEFSSPVEAVRCAVEAQREVENRNQELPEKHRLHFRMGLHMGDVIADGPDLFGDVVNIAARLQEIAQPGRIVLSSAVFPHVVGKIDLGFRALGAQQLKNIPEPIAAYTADASRLPPELITNTHPVLDLTQPVPGFGGKPALAVLPFKNLGPGVEHEFLADGFADDLLTGLSNVRWFPVISRYSSFVFRNDMLDPQSIGRALGARYLVTGSMRRTGQSLRLTVNLIDAENGINLWGQKYDIDFSRLFQVQDDITASIVSVLDSVVDKAEQSRSCARKTEDLDTWELIRRGTWHLYMLNREDSAKARYFFEEALRRDPDSEEARIQLAWWHFWDVWSQRANEAGFLEMEKLARQAMLIDPRDARAHMLVGIAQLMMRKPVSGRAYLLEAIRRNPSLAPAHSSLGSTYILAGEPERGVKPLLLSIRLNPQDLYCFHYLGELAISFHMQGQWGKACEFAERSLQFRPGYWYAKAILIASLARSGRVDKARLIIDEVHCKFSEKQINWLPFVDRKWNEYILDGLEMAGCQMVADPV